jgi:hypothetical protein
LKRLIKDYKIDNLVKFQKKFAKKIESQKNEKSTSPKKERDNTKLQRNFQYFARNSNTCERISAVEHRQRDSHGSPSRHLPSFSFLRVFTHSSIFKQKNEET